MTLSRAMAIVLASGAALTALAAADPAPLKWSAGLLGQNRACYASDEARAAADSVLRCAWATIRTSPSTTAR